MRDFLNAIGLGLPGMDRHAHWSHRVNAHFMRTYRLSNICHLHSQPTCVRHPDRDPPDATNPYAKPYDDALAGHLRNWEPKLR